jgi:hypothetical protein
MRSPILCEEANSLTASQRANLSFVVYHLSSFISGRLEAQAFADSPVRLFAHSINSTRRRSEFDKPLHPLTQKGPLRLPV